jgi:hypothetical protein
MMEARKAKYNSCLTLIIACMIYWQAKEISRVVRWFQSKADDEKIDITLLEHVSPIEWDNVILYGQYHTGSCPGPAMISNRKIVAI